MAQNTVINEAPEEIYLQDGEPTPFRTEKVMETSSPIEHLRTENAIEKLLRSKNAPPRTDKKYNERLDILFEFIRITDEKWEEMNKRSTKFYQVQGAIQERLDNSLFSRLIIVEGTTNPSFKDTQLSSFGTPADAVRMLYPGEIAEYAQIIMQLSGFSNEIIERNGYIKVKNS